MGRVFNDLTYSTFVPTYAGKPLAAIDQTAGVLEDKYYANKDAYDKALIAVTNLQLNEQDAWRRDEAAAALKDSTKAFIDNGDWENASMHIRNEALKIATNEGLRESLKSFQGKQATEKALKDRVGKKEEENGILEEDYQMAMAKGNTTYSTQNGGKGGVYFDETTKTWKGHWGAVDPPKYIDYGKRTDAFLKEAKSNTFIGILTDEKGTSRQFVNKDGKFVWAKETQSSDGSYIMVPSTEELTFEELYRAGRQQLLQAGDVQERLKWDYQKDGRTFEEMSKARGETAEQTRQMLTDDLVRFGGFSKEELKNQSNEAILNLFKQEKIMFDSVYGSAQKYSFVKETVQPLGMSYWAKAALDANNRAAAGGGSIVTVDKDRIIQEYTSTAYNLNKPKSINSFNAIRNAAIESHKIREESVIALQERIKREGDPQGKLRDQLEKIMINRDEAAAKVAELDLYKQYVVGRLEDKHGKDKIEEYFKAENDLFVNGKSSTFGGKSSGSEMKQAAELRARLANITSGFGFVDPNNHDETSLFNHALKDVNDLVMNNYDENGVLTETKVSDLYSSAFGKGVSGARFEQARAMFGESPTLLMVAAAAAAEELHKAGKLTPEMKAEIKGETLKLQEDLQKANTAWTEANNRPNRNLRYFYEEGVGKLHTEVNKEMKEVVEKRSRNYGYVDLSTTVDIKDVVTKVEDFTTRSKWANDETQLFRANSTNYSIYDKKTGKLIPYTTENPMFATKDVFITGISTEPLGTEIGYGLRALVFKSDDKENIKGEGQEYFLVPNPTASPGVMARASQELKKGTYVNRDTGKMGGISWDPENADILSKLWIQDFHDKQLADFNNYPLETPTKKDGDYKSLTKNIVIDTQYDADVTRHVDKAGNVFYDVVYKYKSIDPKTKEVSYQEHSVVGYNDLIEIQTEFEGLANKANPFKVNLSAEDLKKISDTDLTYGETKRHARGSAPYLNKSFYAEFKNLDTEIGKSVGGYEIMTLLRSSYMTDILGTDANNAHSYGKGVDIPADTEQGKKVKAFLDGKAKNGGKIDGYKNLYYSVTKSSKNGNKPVIHIYMK